ncbi:MAG: hypothetical protein U0350_49160 [Caldilineaceae bacterium]
MVTNAVPPTITKPASKIQYDRDFVVADPHIVYYDAVMQSPWNHDSGGHLPERDDWSTYRYTVKDIILGIATHRFNKNTRRLEIRAYFVGEHPIFKELEPTKAMMIVFCCQSYQSGGTMELFFEAGIPFDVRELIERHLSVIISGHEKLLPETITSRLFAALSNFSPEIQARIGAHEVALEMVCYNTYRGTWSSNHIKSLLHSGIPLRWIFKQRPDPLRNPLIYAHLINHLRAALLEEYAIHRLEDRQIGESLGKPIIRHDKEDQVWYIAETDELKIIDGESSLKIPDRTPFCIVPVIPHSTQAIYDNLQLDLARTQKKSVVGIPVVVVPMDFIYLDNRLRDAYIKRMFQGGAQLLVVGITVAQLLSEVELKLAVTAAQMDPDEMDMINVDRYPD